MQVSGGSKARFKTDMNNVMDNRLVIIVQLYHYFNQEARRELNCGLCNLNCDASHKTKLFLFTQTQQSVGAVLQASEPQTEAKYKKNHFSGPGLNIS